MGPPDGVERRPSAGNGAPDNHTDPTKDLGGNDTPDLDLFGEPIEPKVPRKDPRSLDYIRWLRSLPLPDGLSFHNCAPSGLVGVPKKERPFVEAIWCTDKQGRYDHLLLIDLRTRRRYKS